MPARTHVDDKNVKDKENNYMNYYTPITNYHQKAFDTCLIKTLQIAAENKCNQILLVVPQKGAMAGVIEESLPKTTFSLLISKKKAFLKPITIFLQTRRAKHSGFVRGPVLGAYAYFNQLEEFIGSKNIPGIVLYSNVPEDIEAFKKMDDAEELILV